jgi:hypothetical protein
MRRATSNKEGKKEEQKPRFDIGSNSDEGTQSKSPASGNGDVGHVIEEAIDRGTRHPLPPSLPKPHLRSPKQRTPPKSRTAPISPTKTTRPPPLSSQLPLPHPEAVIPQLQQWRKTIVRATSESDYETESNSDSEDRSAPEAGDKVGHDDGDRDWSSEEEGEVDVDVRCNAPVPQRTQLDAVEARQALPLPPSLQQLPQHPTTTTAAATSNNYNYEKWTHRRLSFQPANATKPTPNPQPTSHTRSTPPAPHPCPTPTSSSSRSSTTCCRTSRTRGGTSTRDVREEASMERRGTRGQAYKECGVAIAADEPRP